MARPRKLKLAKSKREIVKLLKLSRKLGANLEKAFKFLVTEESALNKQAKVAKAAKPAKKKPGRRGRPVGKGKKGPKAKGRKAAKGKKTYKGAKPGRKPGSTGWTPEVLNEMKRLLGEGLSVKEVAAKIGRTEATTRQRLYKAGISIRALNAKQKDKAEPAAAN